MRLIILFIVHAIRNSYLKALLKICQFLELKTIYHVSFRAYDSDIGDNLYGDCYVNITAWLTIDVVENLKVQIKEKELSSGKKVKGDIVIISMNELKH